MCVSDSVLMCLHVLFQPKQQNRPISINIPGRLCVGVDVTLGTGLSLQNIAF